MLAYFGSYHWVTLVSKMVGGIIFRSPILYIRHPVGKDPTGQHGAQHCALWVYLMLLQPAEVKHSIVRNPRALNLKKVVQFDLVFGLQCPHVDDDWILTRRGQL